MFTAIRNLGPGTSRFSPGSWIYLFRWHIHYYHPDQLGSASLKAVLPVLLGGATTISNR